MVYFYDTEVFKNFFCVTFISIKTPQKAIDGYINFDIKGDIQKRDDILREFQYEQFIISDIEGYPTINDFQRLGHWIEHQKQLVIVGYNNSIYDNILLDYIFINRNKFNNLSSSEICIRIYEISAKLTSIDNSSEYKARNIIGIKPLGKYTSIDLMKLHYLDKLKISLKQVSITLKWYKVQDYVMPYPKEEELLYYNGINNTGENEFSLDTVAHLPSFERYVASYHIKDILIYNFNDVLITQRLYFEKFNELQLRIDLGELYKVNLLNASRSKIADILLAKFYEEYSGQKYYEFSKLNTPNETITLKEVFHPNIEFSGKIKCDILIGYKVGDQKDYKFKPLYPNVTLKDFVRILGERQIFNTDELAYKVIINGTGYKVMSGGLHSLDGPARFKADDKYTYIDADADSFYPRMVVEYKIKPRHLTYAFIRVADMVVSKRLEIKARIKNDTATPQDKIATEGLKITANSGFFGKMGSDYSWLKDTRALLAVTLNGELNLLMLIEKLEENGFHVISANTDGIVTKIERDRVGLYYFLCREWELQTKMTLEYTEYNDYCRTTVNDYYSINTKDKLKTKGDFSDKLDISKAFMHPVVGRAVREFFINGIPIDKTLRDCNDIYDFCMSVKTGRDYINEYHTIINNELNITRLQKNIRYYVSKKGGTLLKRDKRTNSLHNMVKGYTINIFNNFYPVNNFMEYNINYNYYKMKAMGIIDKALGNLAKDLTKKGGSLFD